MSNVHTFQQERGLGSQFVRDNGTRVVYSPLRHDHSAWGSVLGWLEQRDCPCTELDIHLPDNLDACKDVCDALVELVSQPLCRIRTLKLTGPAWDDGHRLARALGVNLSLCTLTWQMGARDGGTRFAQALARALMKNNTLTTLNLGSSALKDAALLTLFCALGSQPQAPCTTNQTLRHVTLNPIPQLVMSDDCMLALGNMISQHPSLTHLELIGPIQGQQWIPVCTAIAQSRTLLEVRLHLPADARGKEGCRALLTGLKSRPSSQQLTIELGPDVDNVDLRILLLSRLRKARLVALDTEADNDSEAKGHRAMYMTPPQMRELETDMGTITALVAHAVQCPWQCAVGTCDAPYWHPHTVPMAQLPSIVAYCLCPRRRFPRQLELADAVRARKYYLSVQERRAFAIPILCGPPTAPMSPSSTKDDDSIGSDRWEVINPNPLYYIPVELIHKICTVSLADMVDHARPRQPRLRQCHPLLDS